MFEQSLPRGIQFKKGVAGTVAVSAGYFVRMSYNPTLFGF
jgi:hypothetical protein